jgi:hypothetical protein
MNINKSIIQKLKTTNSQVAELLEKLNSFSEQDILELDTKLKQISKKEEIVEEIVSDINYDSVINDINKASTFIHSSSKKLLDSKKKFTKTSFDLLTDIKNHSISSPKIILGKKKSQSKENFTVEKDVQEEKLLILKSIDSKLIFKPNEPKEEKEKDSSDSLFKSIFSNIGSIGGGLAAGKLLKKIPLKKVGKIAGKGFGLVNAAISIKNLIGTVKTGFSDYKRLKASGDNVGASNSLLKALVMGSGNIMNIVGGLIPGPIGWLLMGSGTLFESMAGEFDSIWADKNNKQIQDQQKVARIDDMISTGKNTKGEEILQLRNSLDFKHWEYKDYNTDKWVPLVDNKTGKPLSLSSGRNKVKLGKANEDGIQRYQLETGQSGLVDIVMKNGKPQMLVNDKPTEISTRANGGPVKKGGKYLIGENGPEAYVPDNNEIRRILNVYNNSIIEANKKIVADIQVSSREITKINFPELDITIPKYTVQNMRRDVSFSSIPKMDGTYTTKTLPNSIAPVNTTNLLPDLSKAKISEDVKKALLSLPANSRNYAIKIASIESSYNAKAIPKNKDGKILSSARGLFQFTEDTWEDAIRYSKNPKHKKYTMADRLDPMKSAELFPAFFEHRESVLKKVVANPTDTDYYIAHFMGPAGAARFLKGYKADPNKEAYRFARSDQVKANLPIFYKDGDTKQPRTLQEVYTNFSNKLNSRYSEFGVNFVPVLDKGTDRVKSTGPALLHEGEMIIPAKNANKIRQLGNSPVYKTMKNVTSVKDIEEEFMINTIVNEMANAVKKEYGL